VNVMLLESTLKSCFKFSITGNINKADERTFEVDSTLAPLLYLCLTEECVTNVGNIVMFPCQR
jgi:hypothetical protein